MASAINPLNRTICAGNAEHAREALPAILGIDVAGIFTLLPLLTGEGREHHGAILAEAAKLAEAGAIVPALDPRRFGLASANDAYGAIEGGTARGKLVVDVGEEHAR